jgi:hypothetical protein
MIQIDAVDRLWLPAGHSVPQTTDPSHSIAFEYSVLFGFKAAEISVMTCSTAIDNIPLNDPDVLLWKQILRLKLTQAGLVRQFGIRKGVRYFSCYVMFWEAVRPIAIKYSKENTILKSESIGSDTHPWRLGAISSHTQHVVIFWKMWQSRFPNFQRGG